MIRDKKDLYDTKVSMFGLNFKQKEKLINRLKALNLRFLHKEDIILYSANFLAIYKNGNINYGLQIYTFRDNSFKEVKYTDIIGTSFKYKLK